MAKVKAPRQVAAEMKETKQEEAKLEANPIEKVVRYYADNSKQILSILGGILLVSVLVGGYLWYKGTQNEEANQKLAAALTLLNTGQPQQALDGVGKTTGLRKIAESYSGTDAGNVAQLHAASALLAINKKADAYKFLENFDKSDDAISANAYASMGSIKEDEKNYKLAVEHYTQAANSFKNENTTPQHLLSAARAAALGGDKVVAKQNIDRIKMEFGTSNVAQMLDFEIAQLGL